MQGKYKDEEAAQRRVNKLKTHGIWPGYRLHADGSCTLLYDPEIEADELRHDAEAAPGS